MERKQPLSALGQDLVDHLLNDPSYHDVVFVIPSIDPSGPSEKVGACASFLAARCSYFRTLFDEQGGLGKLRSRRIPIQGPTPATFRQLLYYLHADRLPPELEVPQTTRMIDFLYTMAQIDYLGKLAKQFELEGMKPALGSAFRDLLYTSASLLRINTLVKNARVVALCQMYDVHLDEALFERMLPQEYRGHEGKLLSTLEFITSSSTPQAPMICAALAVCQRRVRTHARKILADVRRDSQDWCKLSCGTVEKFLSSDMRGVEEVQLLQALILWRDRDAANRTEDAKRLMAQCLNLDLFAYSELAREVDPSGLLSSEQLKEAYKFAAGHARVTLIFDPSDQLIFHRVINITQPSFVKFDLTVRHKNDVLHVRLNSGRMTTPTEWYFEVPLSKLRFRVYVDRRLHCCSWPSNQTCLKRTEPVAWAIANTSLPVVVNCFLSVV